ncbi:MAG: permease prefix domain 1-containing protein, partial [Gemmatimonadota bacterium]
MTLLRQFSRGLRALLNRSHADRDVDDELRHYLEQATEAQVQRGLPPHLAQRAAQLEIGSLTSVREGVRSSGWEHAVETLLADLRYALRGLLGAPIFTGTAAVTLAVGIGGATAIFSAVNPILFEPLPYPDPRRLVMVWESAADGSRGEGSYGMYVAAAERSRSFDGIAALRSWQPTMTGADQPERLTGQRVSASYFGILDVAPSLGRAFQPLDDQQNGPRVVIISDALWRRRFSADPA